MHVDSAGAAGDSSGLAPMLAIRSWIMANAFDDITVAKVAARFHYSPSYLTAMYRRVFGGVWPSRSSNIASTVRANC